MKLSHFSYKLPKELVAERPATHRDDARMMVVHRKTGTFEHKMITDLVDYFEEGDCFIVNNSKVFPARMYGYKEKTNARIEVFLLRELNKETRLWDVLVDPARKIRIGNKLFFGTDEDSLVAEVIDNTTSRGRTLRFLFDGSYEEFRQKLKRLGQTPIPKYLNREADAEDDDRYQTIFAKHEGAVAAPVSGLHFSKQLLKRFEIKGLNIAEITLHVGLGTFRPVEVEDLSKHKMDSERLIITQEEADIVNRSIDNKKKIISVGTTTMRALESSITTEDKLKKFDGWTNKFIYPPHDFTIADALLTNFHPPQSTILMMTAAFTDYHLLKKAYNEAIKEKYRFLSYGDAMLIL
ncbi:MAG: tRNA preQ1(34) S-adenosylmethionine ribosyltransferase-isomerase QueA [Cryomorphaceae bacterium]|nr:tRNA preQ1(34) S-adenosylmethionine ribosyltransferase-isomerase QueA [Cryomorphaceae bacterium]